MTEITTGMGLNVFVGLTNTTAITSLTIQQLNDAEFHRRLAPVIYLAVLMALGIPGNLLVLVVYLRDFTRSTHRTFILVLAALDLSVSIIALPFEITEMRFQYMFYAAIACKLFRANNIFLTCASIFTILCMSIERHRRICHPLRSQMTTRMCRLSCLCIIAFSLILSSANFITTGIRHVRLGDNLTGSDCSLDDSFVHSDFPLALDACLFLIVIGVFASLVILYSLIAKQIYKQNKFRSKFAVPLPTVSKPCRIPDKAKREIQDGENDIKVEHMTTNLEFLQQDGTTNFEKPNLEGSATVRTICMNVSLPANGNDKQVGHDSVTSNRKGNGIFSTQTSNKGTAKITKITFTISLVFFLSYLPYLLLSLVTSLKREFVAEPGPIASALLPIVIRSIFINNVANPFIYGFLDPKFRRSCKKLFKTAFGC
ncbi:type-1B angiotensin II receptor-like [Pecten maximus]|uniref:type-1B angiotensin II receptor-like n=1 Tax=Pecten maximus TaxID=6579 RepID=UPI001458FC3E|nr:type-1B angiotensin II receptor-like [Pecten maximus]